MRRLSIALFALGSLVACDSHKETPSKQGSAGMTSSATGLAQGLDEAMHHTGSAAPAAATKPVDHRPLPPLAKDPGDATGKVLSGLSFGGLGIDTPKDMAIAADGSIYVVGYFEGKMTKGTNLESLPPDPPRNPKTKVKPTSDAFLIKIGPDGKIAWSRQWGAKRDDVALGVAIQGNMIAVVGNFLDNIRIGTLTARAANSDDAYVLAFDTKGTAQWLYTAGGVDSDGANAIAAAPDGGWYVGGSFMKVASFEPTRREYKAKGGTDAFLLKLSKGGEFEWVKTFGGNYNDTILHLAVDPRGSVYVQGHFKDKSNWGGEDLVAGGGSDNDVVLAKYDSNGGHLWSKRFGNAFNDVAGGVCVDRAGFVTMVGSFDKSVSFGEGDDHVSKGEADVYIARFDTDGKLQWAKTYGADREDVGWGVAADDAGNTVMTGWFQNKLDFGKTTIPEATSAGNKDVFVIKHDPNGNIVWEKTFGDKDHDQGRAVAIDAKGNAVVAGIFRFSLSAVSPALESVRDPDDRIPKPDVFLLRFAR